MELFRLSATIILIAVLTACSATAFEISPDNPNSNTVAMEGSYAGLTVAVAGNGQALYAVSMNAGIWIALNGTAWKQLAHSPPEATALAVDPNDVTQIIVGDRAGRAQNEHFNHSGVWESSNSGGIWNYVFNSLSAECTSQSIAGIVIDDLKSEFVASICGVFRKNTCDSSFALMTGANAPTGPITGLATSLSGHSKLWMWARTQDSICLFQEENNTWTAIPIPSAVNGTADIAMMDESRSTTTLPSGRCVP
jgi:hypothetical protein